MRRRRRKRRSTRRRRRGRPRRRLRFRLWGSRQATGEYSDYSARIIATGRLRCFEKVVLELLKRLGWARADCSKYYPTGPRSPTVGNRLYFRYPKYSKTLRFAHTGVQPDNVWDNRVGHDIIRETALVILDNISQSHRTTTRDYS